MNEIVQILLLFTLFSIIHSVLAANNVKKFFRNKFPGKFAYYRLFYTASQIILFLIIWINLPRISTTLWRLDGALYYVFRFIQITGIFAVVWSVRDFSTSEFLGLAQVKRFRKNNDVPSMDENYQLNTGGMYAVTRHPLYLFTLIIIAFEPYMTLFKLLLLLWLAVYFYIGSKFEENRLIKMHGKNYLDYKKNVSSFIPVKYFSKLLIRFLSGKEEIRS